MAYEAFGWLGSKVGVDFTGKKKQQQSDASAPATQSSQQSGGTGFFSKVNDAVFGTAETQRDDSTGDSGLDAFMNVDGKGPGGEQATPARQPVVDTGDPDNAPVDENGLPLSRNWYVYNDDLKRWDVTPEAPAWVKKEHEERLKEQMAPKSPLPPPPPPPPPPLGAGSPVVRKAPTTPQYAPTDYFGSKKSD